MLVNYTGDAYIAIIELVNFIESKNTAGARFRWLERYGLFLQSAFINPEIVKHCNNPVKARLA